MKSPSLCHDCGRNGVRHGLEYWTNVTDILMGPFTKPFEKISNAFFRAARRSGTLDRAVSYLLEGAVSLGVIGTADEPNEGDTLAIRCLWEEAKKRGITLREFRLRNGKRDIFAARRGGAVRCFEGLPRPAGVASNGLSWMDNKAILKRKLAAAGFPVARGGACLTEWGARRFFRKLDKPVVVKPHVGSGSRHTTIHLSDETTLIAAFKNAKTLSPIAVIEEELFGSVFRATIVGETVIGVIRRDPPQVVGNGRSTVRELFDRENEHPLRRGPIFERMRADEAAEAELRRQGFTWESVPREDTVVTFHQKINWSVGGTTEDVTDETNPENIRLFQTIGRFISDPLVGIDFIMQDISRPWREERRCGVIEANSLPFIDNHHFPFKGKPRNAAGALWDIVFPV